MYMFYDFMFNPAVWYKTNIEIIFQGAVVVELRVINPDGVGPDGGEDILFCFSVQLDVITSKQIQIV